MSSPTERQFLSKPPLPSGRGKPRRRARRNDRRGSALLEFALIAIVMYLLFAATIEFGRLFHGAQTVQGAVDQAAREISRIPLPPTEVFRDALQDPAFQAVYSEDYLVIPFDLPPGQTMWQYLDGLNLPPVNKALVPLMVVDQVGGMTMLRYPGALVTSSTAASGLTVMVPVVASSPDVGPETIEWHRVLEAIFPGGVSEEDADPLTDPFSVAWQDPSGNNLPGGLVALRLNYPFQAATLAGYQPPQLDGNGETTPNLSNPMPADDAGVIATNSPPNGGTPVSPDNPPADAQSGAAYAGPYGGAYGLGEMGLVVPGQGPQTVRPFRRVISAQAVYRREVFGP